MPTIRENLTLLIEGLVIQEVLRGFNLAKFKGLPKTSDKVEYARSQLPYLGEGSSRIVFALSGGTVLKLAKPDASAAGMAQNQTEIEIFTNPQTQPVIAKIFDADMQKNEWIVAEVTKPLTNQEWYEKTGFTFEAFREFFTRWLGAGKPDVGQYIAQQISSTQEDIQRQPRADMAQGWGMPPRDERLIKTLEQRLTNLNQMAKSPLIPGVAGLIQQGVGAGDLEFVDHYGRTADGRVVVLDYGLTGEVYAQHYQKPQQTNDQSQKDQGAQAAQTRTRPAGKRRQTVPSVIAAPQGLAR